MRDQESSIRQQRLGLADLDARKAKLVVSLAYGLALVFFGVAALVVAADIRERDAARGEIRRLNSELTEHSQKLQLILGSIGDGVIALDGNGGVVLINPAARRILCADPDDPSPQPLLEELDVFYPEPTTPLDRDEWPIARALRGLETDAERMLVRQRTTGKEVWVSVTSRAVLADDTIVGAVAIFRDVSENMRQQDLLTAHVEALDKSNRELLAKKEEMDTFYHTVSHELKTPLTSTREFIALVLDGVAGDTNETQREYLELAKEGCEQIAHCINDLLDVTRAETNKMELRMRSLDATRLVRQTMASMRPAIEAKHITFDLSTETIHLPHVMADSRRLTQVLLNLFSNARKFTPVGGAIRVAIKQSPENSGLVLVSVSNNGDDIAPEHAERIFDRLYQIKKHESFDENGLGLGLFISRKIVEAHGGKIWAESTQGNGVTFTFSVQVATDHEMRNSIPSAA